MSSNATAVPQYNLTLSSSSPLFSYQPQRDGPPQQGWNASYTGSKVWNSTNLWGSGVPYRTTLFEGAIAQIQFTGSAIYLCFTHSSSSYTFAVDQQSVSIAGDPSDPACSTFTSGGANVESMVYATGLSAGQQHTATLELSVGDFTSSFNFFGGVVSLDVGQAGDTPTRKYVNNDATGWLYAPSNASGPGASPAWWDSKNATSGDYDGDRQVTCDYDQGTTATYTFSNASAVYLLGGVQSNTLGYSIMLDGTTATYDASSFFIQPQQVLFLASGLDPTQNHTITASDWNANAPQTGGCLNIDALVLVEAVSPRSNITGSGGDTGSGSSTPTGTIVGGVVGGVGGLALLALLLFLLLRWHRRQREQLLPHPLHPHELPSLYSLPPPATSPGLSQANGSRPTLTSSTSEGKLPIVSTSMTPFPSPPLLAVTEKGTMQETSPRKENKERKDRKGIKRKPVPRALDSEEVAAVGHVPAPMSPSSGSTPGSPPFLPVPSTPGTPGTPSTHATESRAGTTDSPPRTANSGERRSRKKRRRPTPSELQHASTADLVQVLSDRIARGGQSGGQERRLPPGYDEVSPRP
ncbi:hypothetical protein DACRYDRAFT_99771 [Dacryopinax primogenitus]|uniref:Uncharacterized protein n=1 Tax=Dacryopinax primogenitus (strain DJM 731) TaxID=1858805 RepID=M5G246_DACPD|nr:uncharacterized protein DACRYDRAFT_99771 [Dacryopinax primogenitus]EJU02764.1 hypothetical protein DACRYDRAFT_99771 [Dacryopinax primogenitus]